MRPPSSFLARSVAALVVAAAALGVALVVDGDAADDGDDGPVPARAEPASHDPPPVASHPREVLRRWDAARSAAWAAGDAAALAAVYTPESVAGRRDVARLRAWRAQGWRVAALRTQVGAVRVVRETPRRLVLLVADRVAGGVALRPGVEPQALPRDRWDTRELVLRRDGGRWRMVSVAAARLGAAATLAG